MDDNSRVVLITGASTGLGLAIAKILFEKTNDTLVLTARKSSLHRFASEDLPEGPRIVRVPMEICNFDEIEKAVKQIHEKFKRIDVVINNAGISYRTVVEHMTPEDEDMQMRVNYLGVFHLIRQVVGPMRERRKGHIINISSVGGMMAMPTMASYSASKFALEGASEALWYEMKPWNVNVTLVQLGFIHSKSFRNVLMSKKARESVSNPADPYHLYYASMGPFVEKLMQKTFSTPESIAKRILALMSNRNPPVRISGTPDASFFVFLRRFVPRFFYHVILYFNLPNIKKWGPQSTNESAKTQR